MTNGANCLTCELMDNCSFYWSYQKHPDVIERQLVSKYCNSAEEPESCARIRYLKEKKESPPPNLTPEGDLILKTENFPRPSAHTNSTQTISA